MTTQKREEQLRDYLREKNTAAVQLVAWLIVTLVPAFWVLDWFVIPKHIWTTFWLRLLSTAYGLGIIIAIRRNPRAVAPYVTPLGLSLFLSVAWSIAVMCWLHHGYESAYYAGINLLVIGAGFSLVWSFRVSLLFAGLVYVFYMAPLLLGIISITNIATALSNQFFLLSTIVIIVASQRHRYALESREFFGTLDLQETKASLEQAFDQLKHLDRLKSQFFSNITHELRTPLTVILSPLDSLLEDELGNLSEHQKSFLQPIRTSAFKLLKLINNLLDVAKIEEQYFKLRVERTNLTGLLEEVVEHAKPLAARKGITITLTIESSRDDLYVDVEQMDRVVVNLVSNALKFTNPGGEVRIVLRADDKGAQISVKDTGIGIPVEKIESVFERFNQADGTTTRRFGGTGIGLSLAKEIVELHGGHITVSSVLGDGSRFIVHLKAGRDHLDPNLLERRRNKRPTGQTQRAEDHEPREWLQDLVQRPEFRFLDIDEATERRIADRGVDETKTTKILVVEDNIEVLRFLHLTLQEAHSVYLAQDGKRALDLAQSERPDLIITDYMMPEMDGLELIRALRADPHIADTPIIMLTAKNTVEDRLNAHEAGADGYMSKPFSPRELRAAVNALLRRRGRQVSVIMREHVKSLEVISAGLAHEIFNPLSYVRNSLLVINEKVAAISQAIDEVPQETVAPISERIDKSKDIIERMGEVAQRGIDRIEEIVKLVRRYARDGYPTETTPICFDDAVNDVSKLVNPASESVSIEMNLDAPNVVIECIPEEMHQVIRNLWQNALDAVGTNSGHVSVSTRIDNASLIYEVADTGPGIPSDQIKRIFTPFFTTKGPGKGMGLGLAITHHVVDQAGGTIQVDSTIGKGTTFQVRLPTAPPRQSA